MTEINLVSVGPTFFILTNTQAHAGAAVCTALGRKALGLQKQLYTYFLSLSLTPETIPTEPETIPTVEQYPPLVLVTCTDL